MGSRIRRTFSNGISAITAAAPVFRPGTTSPGGSAPFLGAPVGGKARPVSSRTLRRSLRACTAEGIFAEVVTACAGGAVLTGWALHLGCSPLLVGIIAALPQLAQIMQLPAAWTTSLLGHRRACLWTVGLSRQALLPMVVLPFLPVSDVTKQGVLVAVAALSAVLGVLGNNAWVAWMGELVPRPIRGRYFGRRTGLCMLGGALASAAAGVSIDVLRPLGHTGVALAALAVGACVAGVITTLLMLRQHDPAPAEEPARPFDREAALAPFKDPQTRGLLRYQLVWNFAVGIAGSYFALHMLQNLKMGFTLMAIHGTAVALVRMFGAPIWGRAIDRFGARPVLLFCSFGVATVPLLWLFPREGFLWPLVVDAFVGGILWGGHGLAAFALPLAVAPRKGRPYYLAAIALCGGVAFSVSTAAGGLLVQALPASFSLFGAQFANLHVLFMVSAVARVGAAFYALRITEPRARPVRELFRALPSLAFGARAARPASAPAVPPSRAA